jgi:hypothetical protein
MPGTRGVNRPFGKGRDLARLAGTLLYWGNYAPRTGSEPFIYQFVERQTQFVFRRFNMQPKKHRLAAGGCGGELL